MFRLSLLFLKRIFKPLCLCVVFKIFPRIPRRSVFQKTSCLTRKRQECRFSCFFRRAGTLFLPNGFGGFEFECVLDGFFEVGEKIQTAAAFDFADACKVGASVVINSFPMRNDKSERA